MNLFKWFFDVLRGATERRPPPIHVDPPPPPPPPSDAAILALLVVAHNSIRAANNLPPFGRAQKLDAAASGHDTFMATHVVFAHMGVGDGDPWSRITAAGYAYSAAGENIAWNQPDVGTVMKDWMNSPGHRANILGDYAEIGVALARGAKGDCYWTVDFGTPAASRGVDGALRALSSPVSTADYYHVEWQAEHGMLCTPVAWPPHTHSR